jgi:glucokinase
MLADRHRCALAIELGQTSLRSALVSADGRVDLTTEARSDLHDRPDHLLETIESLVAAQLTSAARTDAKVTALGLSSTLDVDASSGQFRCMDHPHLSSWSGFDIRSHLSKRFNLPTAVENDGISAAWGEFHAGAGAGAACLICITLGTGIGGGVVVDGELHPNSLGSAAYLGHTTIDHQGPECFCGQRGCWELYASPSALAGRAQLVMPSASGANVTARDVVAAARSGNAIAISLLDETATYLGIGLASICNIFNPDVIVIGGGFAQAGDLIRDRAANELNSRRMSLRPAIDIRIAALGVHSGLVGMGLLALAIEP